MNPFTFGNPITEPNRFVGRLNEANFIFTRLRNYEFESTSIVGERRIGKTSLLYYVSDPSVQSAQGFDPRKYLFVYMDFLRVQESTTPIEFWQRVLEEIVRTCRDRAVKQVIEGQIAEKIRGMDSVKIFELADIFNSFDENDLRIVLLLDEFDHVTGNKNFGEDFFGGLRSLIIDRKRNLSLITSSRRGLVELCHSKAISSSPFFNIFGTIILRLFTKNEAQNLIWLSLSRTPIRFTSEEMGVIFHFASCHPYLLQIACYFLFEAYLSQLSPSERISYMKKRFLEEARTYFKKCWYDSSDKEKIILTTLAVSEQQRHMEGFTFNLKLLQDLYGRSVNVLTNLENRGLVICKDSIYALLLSSFGDWIWAEITDTSDQQSYSDWLQSNKSIMQRFSGRAKKDMAEILPKISSNYRVLFINWVSDPKNLIVFVGLLKTLGLYH